MSAAIANLDPADIANWSDRRLDALIKRGHKTAGAHSKGYEQASAVTGRALMERKNRLPHGAWLPWLEKHFDGDQKTAWRYMKAAEEYLANQAQMPNLEPSKLAVHHSSESDEWATPDDFFQVVEAEFGPFDLDVCALDSSAKCVRYFTPADDGLVQEWTGRVWMNPPYGDVIPHWVAKAHESATAGATVVCLVPARTDTAWFQDYCFPGEVRFVRGRLRFGDAEASAPFPSALVVRGPGIEKRAYEWSWR